MIKKLYLLIPLAVIFIACNKAPNTTEPVVEDKLPPGVNSFEIVANNYSLTLGTFIDLYAVVDPPFLMFTYEWKASEGVILGSGEKVQYSYCCVAKAKITCTILDKEGNRYSKSVDVDVIE
jgi:hypothetical protein